jgi:hypothetical protein
MVVFTSGKLNVNYQLDPENNPCLVETHLLSPMNGRVYVNLPEGGMF